MKKWHGFFEGTKLGRITIEKMTEIFERYKKDENYHCEYDFDF